MRQWWPVPNVAPNIAATGIPLKLPPTSASPEVGELAITPSTSQKRRPSELMPALMKDDSGKQPKVRYDKGTSTLCFKYEGGVVVAAESRATGGEYSGFTS
ncbi:unnamed protein product [Ixodes persulcatus]